VVTARRRLYAAAATGCVYRSACSLNQKIVIFMCMPEACTRNQMRWYVITGSRASVPVKIARKPVRRRATTVLRYRRGRAGAQSGALRVLPTRAASRCSPQFETAVEVGSRRRRKVSPRSVAVSESCCVWKLAGECVDSERYAIRYMSRNRGGLRPAPVCSVTKKYDRLCVVVRPSSVYGVAHPATRDLPATSMLRARAFCAMLAVIPGMRVEIAAMCAPEVSGYAAAEGQTSGEGMPRPQRPPVTRAVVVRPGGSGRGQRRASSSQYAAVVARQVRTGRPAMMPGAYSVPAEVEGRCLPCRRSRVVIRASPFLHVVAFVHVVRLRRPRHGSQRSTKYESRQ